MNFSLRHYLLAFVLACAAFLFTIAQKHFIATVPLRSAALLVVFSLLSLLFFYVVKPKENTYSSARILAFFWGTLAALVILAEHVIVTFDISYKAIIIMAASMTAPFIGAYMYNLTGNRLLNGPVKPGKTNG